MKIVFLDFDGVLNNNQATPTNNTPDKWRAKHPFIWIEKEKCELLNTIFDDPDLADTKIVISSTWRTSFQQEELMEILNEQVPGLGDRIIGVTKQLISGLTDRGQEIDLWLRENDRNFDVTHFVIIDDNNWFLKFQQSFFVWTQAYKGLSENDIKEAKRILKGEPLVAEFETS